MCLHRIMRGSRFISLCALERGHLEECETLNELKGWD